MRYYATSFLFLATLALALSISACTLVITPPAPAALSPKAVIFSAEQTKAAKDMLGSTIEDTWTPNAADVAKLEAALPAYLQSADNNFFRSDPPIWERVPNYMRQYLGIVENGNEIIYANFFCTVNDRDWHNELVFVLDGGDCFFQLKFNPTTGEFSELSANGPG